MKNRNKIALGVAAVAGLVLTGCATDADTASYNLSTAADQFEIDRRIVFVNGITDSYLLTIEGRCSITDETSTGGAQLEVICAVGPNQYKKHFLGLSDNVTYFVEQLETADVSRYHYRVLFRPEAILPEIDLEAGEQ